MATYTSDLTANVLSACDAVTGWSELPSPHAAGSAPAADTENYFHNSISVSQGTGQATGQGAGIQFDNGSNLTWTATSNWCFFVWTYYAAPTNLVAWASGGMRIGIGSADNNAEMFNVGGNDFGTYPYGGWQNSCFDPEATSDQTIGSPTASQYQNFAVLPNVTAKITKGSPTAVDVVRYGRGEIKAIGTASTFTGMATFNDNATTGRYGLFAEQSGSYLWKGLMSLGDASNTVTFSDSNKVIRVEDTARVLSGFNKIEINHASSSVTWTSISISGVQTSITGSAPVSPGDFEVVGDATVTKTSCTFTDMGTFDYLSNSTITGSTWRRCGLITQNDATITSCIIDSSTSTTAAILADDVDLITDTDFTSDGTGYAIELDTAHAGNSYTLTNLTYDGYAATDGSTGNECIYNNSGGAVTLSISGGDTPTIRNGTDASTTLQNFVTVRVDGVTEGAAVKVVAAETLGTITLGDTILEGLADSTGALQTTTFNYEAAFTTGIDVIVRVRASGLPTAAIQDDNGSYTDQTTNANSATTNDMNLLPATPVVNQDGYIFGHAEQFTQLKLDVGTAGTGGFTITWQYWNGSGWSSLTGVTDGTSSLSNLGQNTVSWTLPGGWATTTINSQGPYYYIRALYSAGSVTIVPLGRKCKLDVAKYLPFNQDRTITSSGLTVTASWNLDTIATF